MAQWLGQDSGSEHRLSESGLSSAQLGLGRLFTPLFLVPQAEQLQQ